MTNAPGAALVEQESNTEVDHLSQRLRAVFVSFPPAPATEQVQIGLWNGRGGTGGREATLGVAVCRPGPGTANRPSLQLPESGTSCLQRRYY